MPAVARYGPHGVAVGEAPARAAGWKCSVRGPSCYLARFADLPECARAAAPFPVLDVDGAMRLDLLYAHVAPGTPSPRASPRSARSPWPATASCI